MNIEFEAKFFIDVQEFQQTLKKSGAILVRPRGLMRRFNFKVVEQKDSWLRVRDEGEYVTLALKSFDQTAGIESLKELEIKVSNFDTTVQMLQNLGYQKMIYAENYREIWQLQHCFLMIDQWPGLDPLVEIEGPSKSSVHEVAELLGFDMKNARYGTTSFLYQEKYHISQEMFRKVTELTFESLPEWIQKI